MPFSANGIITLLQEQLDCCRRMETMAEEAINLFQSAQLDPALTLLQERDRLKQHLEEVEDRLGKEQVTTLNSRDRAAIAHQGQPIAEAIRASVEHQIEVEEQIIHLLDSLLTTTHGAMKDSRDGQKLFTTYIEEWAEGSEVDITVR